jgi:hypothetical protein
MSALVPSFANGGISLVLDDEGFFCCQITRHTTRCAISTSLVPGVSGGASDEAEEEEAPTIGDFFGRLADLLFPVERTVEKNSINRIVS